MRAAWCVMIAIGLMWAAERAYANGTCDYDGQQYLNGSAVCQSGAQYQCQDGKWKRVGDVCPQQSVTSQRGCRDDGQTYASGITRCLSGKQHRCEDGEWKDLGPPCVAPDGSVKAPAAGRTCPYGAAQFHPQSMMCRNGATFICDGGQWRDLGRPCP